MFDFSRYVCKADKCQEMRSITRRKRFIVEQGVDHPDDFEVYCGTCGGRIFEESVKPVPDRIF